MGVRSDSGAGSGGARAVVTWEGANSKNRPPHL